MNGSFEDWSKGDYVIVFFAPIFILALVVVVSWMVRTGLVILYRSPEDLVGFAVGVLLVYIPYVLLLVLSVKAKIDIKSESGNNNNWEYQVER